MTRALLDVNVLLALFDSDHVDHSRARAWLESEIGAGWASCAITENGFVRIISQPRYPSPVSPHAACVRLARATSSTHHEFWPCSASLVDATLIDPRRIHSSRHVTDAYLLALAAAHGGRFVTFDRSIPLDAVPGMREDQLVVLQ